MAERTLDILIRARDEATRTLQNVGRAGVEAGAEIQKGLSGIGDVAARAAQEASTAFQAAAETGTVAAKEVDEAWDQVRIAGGFGASVESAIAPATAAGVAGAEEVQAAWSGIGEGAGSALEAGVKTSSEAAASSGVTAAEEVSAAWKTVGEGAGAGLAAGVETSSATAASAGVAAAEEVSGAWAATSRATVASVDSAAAGVAAASEKEAGSQISAARAASGAWAGFGGRLVGFAGTVGIAAFGLHAVLEEASQAQTVAAQTAAVLQSTGGAAGVSAGHVAELAQRLSDLAAVDDEVIAQGENVLLTFTNIRNQVGAGNDIFDQATTAALDLSAAMGTDLQSAVVQVGKALNDPIKGITALQRVGVSFTQQQRDEITTLVETGRALDAQKIILGELTREFGGAAAANATAGDRIGKTFGDIEETLGTGLLPVLDVLNDVLKVLSPVIDLAASHARELLLAFAAYKTVTFVQGVLRGIGAAVVGLNLAEEASGAEKLGAKLAGLGASARGAATRITSFVRAIPTGLPTLGALAVAVGAVVIGMGELNETTREVEEAQRSARKELKETGEVTKTYGEQLKALNEELANTSIGHEVIQGGAAFFLGEKTSAEQLADSLNSLVEQENRHREALAQTLGETLGLSQKTAAAVGNFFTGTGRQATLAAGHLSGITAALAASAGASDEAKQAFAELFVQYRSVTGGLRGLNTVELQHLIAEGKLSDATDEVNAAFERYFGTMDKLPGAVGAAGRSIDQFNQFFGTNLDLLKGAKQATAEASQAYMDWRNNTAQTLNFVGGAFSELAQKENQSVEGLKRGLDKNLEEMRKFGADLNTIAKDGGRGAQELVRQLLALGPAGVEMADKLVAAGKEGRRGIEDDLGGALKLATTEAGALERALTGGFQKIAASILIATGKAHNMAEALKILGGKVRGIPTQWRTDYMFVTHYEAIGSPPPGTPAQIHGGQVLAATGFHDLVREPTWIRVAEGGQPERVDITPTSHTGSEAGRAGTGRLSVAVNIDRRRYIQQQDYELRFGGPA